MQQLIGKTLKWHSLSLETERNLIGYGYIGGFILCGHFFFLNVSFVSVLDSLALTLFLISLCNKSDLILHLSAGGIIRH